MTKTPTAEEVLGLYLSHLASVDWYRQSQGEEAASRWIELEQATGRLDSALKQWQAAQGAVTREWFQERFGGPSWSCIDCELTATSTRILLAMRISGNQWASIPLRDPTREDIERLVQVLGGSAN